jgi:hypothetical protein
VAPQAPTSVSQPPDIETRTDRVVVEGEKAVTALTEAGMISDKQGKAVKTTLAAVAAVVALVLGLYNATFGQTKKECEVDLQPGTAVVVTETSTP